MPKKVFHIAYPADISISKAAAFSIFFVDYGKHINIVPQMQEGFRFKGKLDLNDSMKAAIIEPHRWGFMVFPAID